jgi:hypothetical protein
MGRKSLRRRPLRLSSSNPSLECVPPASRHLGDGFYPINVLNAIKMVAEVCRIFCAMANPTEVVLDETEQGRGILDVVDGSPIGVENETDIEWRHSLLRKIGYKLCPPRSPMARSAHARVRVMMRPAPQSSTSTASSTRRTL